MAWGPITKAVPGLIPVPVSETVWGLSVALSVIVIDPCVAPVAPGLNVTLTVQVLLGVIVAPVQVSVSRKSLGFVPPIVTVEMVRLAVPVLVTITVWGTLVVPTFCVPNARLASERLTNGALYTSASAKGPLKPQPPVISTAPLFSSVAVW